MEKAYKKIEENFLLNRVGKKFIEWGGVNFFVCGFFSPFFGDGKEKKCDCISVEYTSIH